MVHDDLRFGFFKLMLIGINGCIKDQVGLFGGFE